MSERTVDLQAGYEVVPFAEAHVAPLTAWFNALENNGVWSEAWVRRKTIQDRAYDPALMLCAQDDGAPVGFVLGNVADGRGWIRAFLVAPDRQRRGIGTLLFDQVEKVFAERGITEVHAGWALPTYFLPGIDIRYTSAIVFLDRRGYQTSREARVNLDVIIAGRDWDTSQAEAELATHGIRVRRARPGDEPAIAHLCETHGYHGWAIETAMALEEPPITAFVAELASSPDPERAIRAFAVHSVASPIHFGPMLTAVDLRGLGIGSILLKRCLQDWQQAGVPRCEIVWAGPLSFYARSVDATIGRAFWTFHKSLA
jgi:mycothiol synthase